MTTEPALEGRPNGPARDSPSPLLTLALDTGSPVTSVALGRGRRILGWREAAGGRSSSSLLALIDDLLADCETRLTDIDRLIAARGPGSFTGLRVGLATALGLHQALGIQATALGTLQALAAAARQSPGEPLAATTIVAVVDALRGEWFAQPWPGADGAPLAEATIVDSSCLAAWAPCRVTGFELDKLIRTVSSHEGIELIEAQPLAPTLLELANLPDTNWDPAPLVKPLYLRPPAAKPSPTT